MRKSFLSIIIFLITISLTGCDPFVYPSGDWICEELGVTVDFSIDVDFSDSYNNGTIVNDGISKDIVVSIGVQGYMMIYYPPDDELLDNWATYAKANAEQIYEDYIELYESGFHHKDTTLDDYITVLRYNFIWRNLESFLEGRLEYKRKDLIFHAYEWIDDEWVEKGEYLFVLSGDL